MTWVSDPGFTRTSERLHLARVHPPPILVVGTPWDNATPYQQAVALAKALRTATLLTYDGEGNLAYLRDVACIDTWSTATCSREDAAQGHEVPILRRRD